MAAQAVFTDLYRTKYGNLAKGSVTSPDLILEKFNVGERGFVEIPPASGNRFPLTPDPSFTDIVSDNVTANKFAANEPIINSNISHDGSGTVTIVCKLASNEAELDGEGIINGGGSDSHLFEIGIFDTDGDMMVYGTYDEEIKLAGKAIDLTVVVSF